MRDSARSCLERKASVLISHLEKMTFFIRIMAGFLAAVFTPSAHVVNTAASAASVVMRARPPVQTAQAPRDAAISQVASITNFWILVPLPDNSYRHSDGSFNFLLDDSELVRQVREGEHAAACRSVLASRREDGAGADYEALSGRPVAVELSESEEGRKRFRLPTGVTVGIREMSYGDAGLGGSTWDCGVAMSIWLSLTRGQECCRGQRVLELGSGCGIGGMAARHAGASSVVMTDFGGAAAHEIGNEEQAAKAAAKAARLQDNLRWSAEGEACRRRCFTTSLALCHIDHVTPRRFTSIT